MRRPRDNAAFSEIIANPSRFDESCSRYQIVS
jgi:hypothetical protein